MMKCRNCWRYFRVTFAAFKNLAFVCIYALVLSAIPIVHPTKAGRAAYLLLLMTGLWMTEVIPLYVTALIPIFLGPILGLASSYQISMAYTKDTNMLFLGGLFVACALEYRNFHKRLAISIFSIVGGNPKMIMLGIMIPSWFLSMWMSNTATTAMMITIVEAILVSLNESIADPAEDVELSANEGGLEIVRKASVETTMTNDDLESNGPVDSVYSMPDSPDEEISKEERAKMIRKLNIGFSLSVCYASTCGGIATITGTPPNSVFYGMVLNTYGSDTGLNYGTWIIYALPISILMLLFTWFWLGMFYIGFKDFFRCRSDSATKQVIMNMIESNKKTIGRFSYAEGQCCVLLILLVLLWITRSMGPYGWERLFLAEGSTKSQVTDSAPAILIAILCMILPAWNPVKIWKAWNEHYGKPGAAIPEEEQYILPWNEAKKRMSWGVILVVGGGFALADICKISGLSDEIGKFLSHHLSVIPVSALTLVCALVGGILTEFTSNTATASILIPIMFSLSQKMGLHPFQLTIPTVLSTSFAFIMPASTPPNTIVFARGRVPITHMICSGIMVNVVASLITLLATSTYARPLFGLDKYPAWAPPMENGTALL